jgi:prefoldin subunit 5
MNKKNINHDFQKTVKQYKNNLAAIKYRRRKKEKLDDLQNKVEELERELKQLKSKKMSNPIDQLIKDVSYV